MVTASRWCRRRHVVPRPRGDATGVIDGVERAVAGGGYDVVFGGSDDWMAALATYRNRIPARVAHPPIETVAGVIDKVELAANATDAGLRPPRTELATEAALEKWNGPVVVRCRTHWHPGQVHPHRVEARRYPDVGTAVPRIRFRWDAGFEPILQEPIEGRLGALIGLYHDGRLRGRVQQESPRLWPTPSGVSSRAETVPVDERLAARASALLARVGWWGLVELQFLVDDRGTPHLIDFNGRFYGSMTLACAAGPNLPDAWARQALGLPMPPPRDARPGFRFLPPVTFAARSTSGGAGSVATSRPRCGGRCGRGTACGTARTPVRPGT